MSCFVKRIYGLGGVVYINLDGISDIIGTTSKYADKLRFIAAWPYFKNVFSQAVRLSKSICRVYMALDE